MTPRLHSRHFVYFHFSSNIPGIRLHQACRNSVKQRPTSLKNGAFLMLRETIVEHTVSEPQGCCGGVCRARFAGRRGFSPHVVAARGAVVARCACAPQARHSPPLPLFPHARLPGSSGAGAQQFPSHLRPGLPGPVGPEPLTSSFFFPAQAAVLCELVTLTLRMLMQGMEGAQSPSTALA